MRTSQQRPAQQRPDPHLLYGPVASRAQRLCDIHPQLEFFKQGSRQRRVGVLGLQARRVKIARRV